MSMPTVVAPQSAFQSSARPLPQPRSTTRSPAPARGRRGACRCGSSSRAAAATRVRGARRRAAPRPGTSSARRIRLTAAGRGYAALAARYRRPHPEHVTARRLASAGDRHSGQRTSASSRSEIIAARRRHCQGAPRAARRAAPRCSRHRCRPRLPRAGRRAPDLDRTRRMPAASAGALPGVDEQGVDVRRQHLAHRRQIGGHDRPSRGHVLEQLQRRGEAGRDRRRRIRQHQDGCLRQERANVRRLDQPGERHSRRDARAGRASALDRARSGSFAWPPTISPSASGTLASASSSTSTPFHAYRWPAYATRGRSLERAISRAGPDVPGSEPRRHRARSARCAAAHRNARLEVVRQPARDRDIAVRAVATLRASRVGEPAQLPRARRRRSRDQRRQRRRHVGA